MVVKIAIINFSFTGDVESLTRPLILINDKSTAKKLQNSLDYLLRKISNSLDTIWKPIASFDETSEEVKFGPEATTADIINRKQAGGIYQPNYNLLGNNQSSKVRVN